MLISRFNPLSKLKGADKVAWGIQKIHFKGNVFDLAVAVIIGGAVGKIISSLVNDILIPIIGLLLGGVDFSALSITVLDAEIKYGMFIQTVLDFLIITFTIFLLIRIIRKPKKQAPAPPPTPPEPTKEELLLTEIRDLLKKIKQPDPIAITSPARL